MGLIRPRKLSRHCIFLEGDDGEDDDAPGTASSECQWPLSWNMSSVGDDPIELTSRMGVTRSKNAMLFRTQHLKPNLWSMPSPARLLAEEDFFTTMSVLGRRWSGRFFCYGTRGPTA